MLNVFQRALCLCLSVMLMVTSLGLSLLPVSHAADDSIVINQVQLQLTNDANANGFANIGDQLTISVQLNNADGGCVAQGTSVTANLTAFGGGANDALNCGADNGGVGDVFGLQFNIQDAAGSGIDVGTNDPSSQITVTASDADENNGSGNPNPTAQSNPLGDGGIDNTTTNGVDTIAPQVNDVGITANLTVDNGTASVAGVNDVILVTYTPAADGNNDPNPNEIRANLTAIGGAGNQQLFDDGTNGDVTNADGIFSFALSIAEGAGGGIDGAGLQVGVAMEDDAGNNSGAAVNDSNTFTVDNVSPTVTDGNIQSTITVDNNTPAVAEVGDVIRTTWDNSGGGDNNGDTLNTITADLSAFGGGASQQLFDDGTNGDQTNADGVFTFDYTVVGGAINANNLNASVSVTDNAGNQTQTADSSNLTVNNGGSGGGGTRRLREVRLGTESDQESVVSQTAQDCGCEESYNAFDLVSIELADQMLTYPESVMCFVPTCWDSPVIITTGEESDAEKKYREVVRDRFQKSHKLSQAFTERNKKVKEHQQAEGEYQDQRLNQMIGKGDPVKLRETKEERDKTASAAEQAEQDYIDASQEFEQAVDKIKETREQLGEELKEEDRRRIFKEEMERPQGLINGCYDPYCGYSPTNQSSEILELQFDYDQKLETYNECLSTCQETEPVKPLDLDLSEFQLDPRTTTPEEIDKDPIYEDLPVFEFSSVLTEQYATDIFQSPQRDFIVDLYQRKVVSGINGGETFGPEQLLNRAEMLKIIMEAFGLNLNLQLLADPFPDVPKGQWFAPYFDIAERRGVITGYPDGTAKPGQHVSRVEALAMATRASSVNLDEARNHEPQYVDFYPNEWWAPVVRWADMYGLIDNTQTELKPAQTITREEMAEIASKTIEIVNDGPCNCDKEKKAWEEAEKEAIIQQKEAEAAQEEANTQKSEADAAQKALDDAEKAVDDLEKFFDDSSYVESDGERVTTGDLALLREANRGIQNAWLAGDLTAEEAMEEWEKTDKDALEELRAQKAAELEAAKKKRDEAKAKNEAEQKEANDAQSKADREKTEADDARKKADDARKVYEECTKKCEEKNKAWAEQQRKEAEERRRRYEEWKREQERKAREARAAEERDRQRNSTPPPSSTSGGSSGGNSDDGGGGGVPAAAKDPCKEKFLQAVAARGKQIAKTRPDDVPEVPPAVKTVLDVSTAVGDLIANAASSYAQGGSTALSVANALTALPGIAYGLWVDYVGETIKAAGTRIINNSRICKYVKYATSGVCGYVEFPPGQVVYWQRDSEGNIKVIVMGPGGTKNVSHGQCQ